MSARSAYYTKRKVHRASQYAYAVAMEAVQFADGPMYSIERDAAASLLRPAPRGYGRMILDPLVVRRAQRSELRAVKIAYATGQASDWDVCHARADLTGESPSAMVKLSMKRTQCAAHAVPQSIADRYFGDVRYFTALPETLARRYASFALTETERDERRYPSDARARAMRAAARKPLPLPRDLLPFEWRAAA